MRRPIPPSERETPLSVFATLEKRSVRRRAIRLTGDVQTLVEYVRCLAGPSEEVVLLDGTPCATRRRSGLWEGHSLLFEIPAARGKCRASIKVELAERFVGWEIVGFRLRVGDITVYEEAGDRLEIRSPSNLPLPSRPPDPAEVDLPRPASEHGVAGTLPVPAGEPEIGTQELEA